MVAISGGSGDSEEDAGFDDDQPAVINDDEYLETLRRNMLLGRFPRVAEIAESAALAATGRASAMIAAAVTVTCGHVAD